MSHGEDRPMLNLHRQKVPNFPMRGDFAQPLDAGIFIFRVRVETDGVQSQKIIVLRSSYMYSLSIAPFAKSMTVEL